MSAKPITTQPGCDLYDHEIDWQPFAGIENLELTLCDLDEERHVVDLIVRFAPKKTVTMHNHLAQTNMLIIQGELRMYEPDGRIREVRPAGRTTAAARATRTARAVARTARWCSTACAATARATCSK